MTAAKRKPPSRSEVLAHSSALLCAVSRGAGLFPSGQDVRDVVRSVRVMLSEVDKPTARPAPAAKAKAPDAGDDHAELAGGDADLLEGLDG